MNGAWAIAVGVAAVVGCATGSAAQELPEWVAKIRPDHPRLFLNADTLPQVRERALGPESAWYGRRKATVDQLLTGLGDAPEVKEHGQDAAMAAFVYLVERDPQYLDLAKRLLDLSLTFYEQCYAQKKSVNWYSTSRVHATLAWDWLYTDLTEDERRRTMSRLVQVLQQVFTAKPAIYRENISGYTTGFYGAPNCKWFIGCTAYGTGIEEALVNEWLVWGRDENLKLLAHRQAACGDDGGSASPTLGYAFGAYPWAEQNFLYTWLSATGENIAPDWPHSAWLANYVIWNWIETGGQPLEFGYGDTPHTTNELPSWELFTHMANLRHLHGRQLPEAAALARHVQGIVPERQRGYGGSWFIYPFLLSEAGSSPPPLAPESLPHARNFESMGQVYMRSGTGPEDTYCLFTCGGTLAQHRHFDALNFVIYHRGHLALDSGTRYAEEVNGQHLANYYAQTVAHNCVLVHQPGEPPARYWGGTVEGNHGGQHRQLGSVLEAFETSDRYVYVAGDATACYLHGGDLPEKVGLVARQLVFLMPSHFVILDRVTTTDPALRKEWLLHTAYEPAIEGSTLRANHREGRLFCRTLLPRDAVLTPVGGPGREFWAAGRNWDLQADKLTPENLAMMGQWRVEISPGSPRTEDVFLHVMQVGDAALEAMDATELLDGADTVGVRVSAAAGAWEVTFATRGDLAGHVRLTQAGAVVLDTDLATGVQPQVGILARAE